MRLAVLLVLLPFTASAQVAGGKHRVEAEGWEIKAPATWKVASKGSQALFGSDTEAGLIVAGFEAGVTYDAMKEKASQAINDQSVSLQPVGTAKSVDVKGAKALVNEYTGMAADGTQVKAKGWAIVGSQGAVVILGLTTPQMYANLAKRTDEIAKSTTFFSVKSSAGVGQLKGSICAWSGNSTYSSSKKMTFDGAGRVTWGSEFVAGGSFKDGGGNDTGSWGAYSGNQNQATSAGTYKILGNNVVIAWPGEGMQTCEIHFKQKDGRITELKCDGTLWGSGLCE